MAHAHEAGGQDVQQKATEELSSAQGHLLAGMAVGVVLVAEADQAVAAVEDTFVRESNPVGVAAEVVQDLVRTGGQRGLGVDDPRLGAQLGQEALPGHGTRQRGTGTVEDHLPLAVRGFEPGQELAAKHCGEGADGKEKAPLFAGEPPLPLQAQAAPGDDTVKVDVGHEGLPPGVQDRREAKLGSQMLGIAGELFESFGHRLEEAVIEQPLMAVDHLVERMGQGEDEVEVRNRQEQGVLGRAPLGLR